MLPGRSWYTTGGHHHGQDRWELPHTKPPSCFKPGGQYLQRSYYLSLRPPIWYDNLALVGHTSFNLLLSRPTASNCLSLTHPTNAHHCQWFSAFGALNEKTYLSIISLPHSWMAVITATNVFLNLVSGFLKKIGLPSWTRIALAADIEECLRVLFIWTQHARVY